MKTLVFCLLSFASSQLVLAQSSDNKAMVSAMVKHWEASKDLSLAVANAMPDADYAFKATPAEMSFGQQMNHIAAANGSYCSAAIGTKSPIGKAADDTKATAVKNITTAYDFCIDGIKEMTDADLLKTVSRGGNSVTKFELFWGGFTHAAHHRGQAEVYLRLKGVTPPTYKF
jgi:uncharacterized damage-inducible protein DinB